MGRGLSDEQNAWKATGSPLVERQARATPDQSNRADTKLEQALSKAFYLAPLLTQNSKLAEQAVGDAIEATECGAGVEEPLEIGQAIAMLPAELQRVASLPSPWRQCFVLWTRAGLPEDACARLLRLSRRQVSDYTTMALREVSLSVAR